MNRTLIVKFHLPDSEENRDYSNTSRLFPAQYRLTTVNSDGTCEIRLFSSLWFLEMFADSYLFSCLSLDFLGCWPQLKRAQTQVNDPIVRSLAPSVAVVVSIAPSPQRQM
jgi:hypothetical protein